jgi:hypothetical protein
MGKCPHTSGFLRTSLITAPGETDVLTAPRRLARKSFRWGAITVKGHGRHFSASS